MDWIFLTLALGSGLFFTAGDILFKFWADWNDSLFMYSGFSAYIVAGILLALSFRRKEIAIAVAVLVCFNLLLVALLGYTVFNELLGTKEIIGLSLAILALFILNI